MAMQDERLIRLPEVKARTGLGRTLIYEGVKEGWFPRPVKITIHTVGWPKSSIDSWIASRIAASQEQKAA